MPKGITPIIAMVLLLVITVSIAGFAMVFFSRTVTDTSNGVGNQTMAAVDMIGMKFSVDNIHQNVVYVRNEGTKPLSGIAVYVNDIKAVTDNPTIAPGSVGAVTIDDSWLGAQDFMGLTRITISGPNGVSKYGTVDYGTGYDSKPPSVQITSPVNGAPVSGLTPIMVSANDNFAVAGVQFQVDGTNLGSEVTSPPYMVSWSTSSYGLGSHTITAVARDTSNNYNFSTVTVTVDNTPPVMSNGQPSGVQPMGTTSVTLGLTTNKDATCKYDTTPGTAYAAMANTFSVTGGTSHSSVIAVSGGAYTFYARCMDLGSNVDTSDYTISFTVSSSPIAISSPTSTTYGNSVVSVKYTFISSTFQPSQCRLELDGKNMSYPYCSNMTLTYVHYNDTDPNKVLGYDFADGQGTITYDRANMGIYDGNFLGANTFWNASGMYGYGISENGNAGGLGGIQVSPSFSIINKNVTMMFWLYRNSYGFYQIVFDSAGYGRLVMCIANCNGPTLQHYDNGGVWRDIAGINNGQWYHIAAVYDTTGTASFYVNGALVNTLPYTMTNVGNPTNIGLVSWGGWQIDGTISQFAMWNRSLTGPEIANIYSNHAYAGTHTLKIWANDTFNNWDSSVPVTFTTS